MSDGQYTSSERRLRGKRGAEVLHSRVDSRRHTEPARRAFLARFEDEVDRQRELPEEERLRRAQLARKAYFTGLALASVTRRRQKRAATSPRRRGAKGADTLGLDRGEGAA